MHHLEFREWLYEEGFFGDMFRKAKLPMFALSGGLILGAGQYQSHEPIVASPPQVKLAKNEIGVTLPRTGFAFHLSGYEPIKPEQLNISKIRHPNLFKNIGIQAAIKAMGGEEGLKNRIVTTLNQAGSYDYATPGKEFGPKQDLSGQWTVIQMNDTPVDLGNGMIVNITGNVRVKAKDAWIAFGK